MGCVWKNRQLTEARNSKAAKFLQKGLFLEWKGDICLSVQEKVK